ncbi:MAG: L-fucose/L-arabinose isomerase family protein [Planctomycetota bacterium]|nr:L-fucose/L-arabinose isomerase family protein [Planctomycetota bacterium]
MAKVGILSFSDGRDFVHKNLVKMLKGFEERIVKRLQKAGHEVVTAKQVWTNSLATSEAKKLARAGCECTIFNYAVWCFPHFTALASRFAPGPLLAFGCINPKFPGMVGLLAGVGGLNQLGVRYDRVFGEIEDERVFAQVQAFIAAAHCANTLKGQTYGLVGGRPMGMYTAVSNPDQWMQQFGVDVEHIDQWELVRRADSIPQAQVTKARKWLEKHVGRIEYDGRQLTPELLERQIRTTEVMKKLIKEWNLDFSGIKGQPELTTHWCTMDLTEAFLNDPYDWDGPHEPHVCSTEADMDAALTMQIFKLLTEVKDGRASPVLFADVRHYFEKEGVFDLVNSGQHATYFAKRSFKHTENLPHVRFRPEGFYFPAGGASVMHLAEPGKLTFARLTRRDGKYWMAILTGEFVRFGEKKDWELVNAVQDNWPHAFAKFDCPAETFLQAYSSNHIHAVYGDYVEELKKVCHLTGVESVVLK